MTSKAQTTKETAIRLNKNENSYATKNTIKKIKKQPTEWEKIFAIYNCKRPALRMYRELKNTETTELKLGSVWEFPGGIPCFHCQQPGFNPSSGSKDPTSHSMQPKKKKKGKGF